MKSQTGVRATTYRNEAALSTPSNFTCRLTMQNLPNRSAGDVNTLGYVTANESRTVGHYNTSTNRAPNKIRNGSQLAQGRLLSRSLVAIHASVISICSQAKTVRLIVWTSLSKPSVTEPHHLLVCFEPDPPLIPLSSCRPPVSLAFFVADV